MNYTKEQNINESHNGVKQCINQKGMKTQMNYTIYNLDINSLSTNYSQTQAINLVRYPISLAALYRSIFKKEV